MQNNTFEQNKWQFEGIETARCSLIPMTQKFAQDILDTCTLDVCEYFDHPIHQDIDGIRKQIDNREKEKSE
jgi:hypothetical protein